jgi:AdoMet-dependent heme synthase
MIIAMSETEGYEIFLQHVQFEVTGKCNMRCQHCRAWAEAKTDLPMDVMRNIIEFVLNESENGFGVTISGGEPFTRGDLPEIVKLVASSPARLMAITTNGSLCTEKNLSMIAKAKGSVDTIIQVSLDSAKDSEHDRFRDHVGAYRLALGTLKCAQSLGLSTAIRTTISKGQTHSMEELVNLARSLSVRSISFGTVVPFGRASDNSMGMTPDEKHDFLLEVTRLKAKFNNVIQVDTEDPLKAALGCNDVWGLDDIDPNDDLSYGGCTAGITTLNVTSEGIITPCAVLSCEILDARGKNALTIKDEYVQSQIVKNLLSRSFGGKCGSCSLKRVCGGCRAIPFALTGELMGQDSTCWYRDNVV